MRRMNFNDGEGIVFEDLNMLSQLSERALTRYALSNIYYPILTDPLIAGTGTPLFVRGSSWAHSGTGNRTFTFYNSLWCQFDDGFDDAFDLAGDAIDFNLLALPDSVFTFDAATSGAVYRRDIIEVQMASELLTAAESRDFKDATTGVVTSQSMSKRRVRRLTAQVKKGTDQASEVLADANEPAVTAGWTKIYSVLIPPTGNNVDATKDIEHFISFNARRVRVTAMGAPPVQGAHNNNGYWYATGGTNQHQVPIPVAPNDRLLRIKWLYQNNANPGSNKEFGVYCVDNSGTYAYISSRWVSNYTGTPLITQSFTQGRGGDIYARPFTFGEDHRLVLASFISGGISDRFYVADCLIDTPLYF